MPAIAGSGFGTMVAARAFLVLLAASPVVELIGQTTPFPTHINIGYKLLLLLVALASCPITQSFIRALGSRLVLPVAYVAGFIAVSYFGVAFEYSLKYRVMALPLLLVDFTLWFMAAFYFDARVYLRLLLKMTCLFGLTSLLLANAGLIDPTQTRVISGLDLPIAMPVAIAFGSFYLGGLIVLVSLASLKKTVVACTLIACLVSSLLAARSHGAWRFPSARDNRRARFSLSLGVSSIILLATGTVLVYFFSPYVMGTIERIVQDGEDILRMSAALEFVRLLREHFPSGTGYYTFGWLTKEDLPYVTLTASGVELDDGMSLHNTFMHWALEGGLVVLIVVFFLYLSFARTVKHLYSIEASRPLAIVLITWVVVSMIFAQFQQLHASKYFFGVLGFAFGAYERNRHFARRRIAGNLSSVRDAASRTFSRRPRDRQVR